MRVLLAMREGEKREQWRLRMESERSDLTVACVSDGRNALAKIRAFTPDILLLDQILPLLDGQAVLETLRNEEMVCPPKVIFLTVSSGLRPCALLPPADIYLPASADFDALFQSVSAVQAMLQGTLAYKDTLRRGALANEYFNALGMPAKLSGRAYLAFLLDLVIPSPPLLDALTNRLYPAAAVQFHTTSQAIERCIRHAIETTWSRGDMAALERLFGLSIDPDRGKPTNREFLAMSAQHLRIASCRGMQSA